MKDASICLKSINDLLAYLHDIAKLMDKARFHKYLVAGTG